jgi:hypothetical protein
MTTRKPVKLVMLDCAYMKKFVTLGMLIFSTLGGWLGTTMDHGNGFGGWAILMTALGGFLGIWIGYKVGQNWG